MRCDRFVDLRDLVERGVESSNHYQNEPPSFLRFSVCFAISIGMLYFKLWAMYKKMFTYPGLFAVSICSVTCQPCNPSPDVQFVRRKAQHTGSTLRTYPCFLRFGKGTYSFVVRPPGRDRSIDSSLSYVGTLEALAQSRREKGQSGGEVTHVSNFFFLSSLHGSDGLSLGSADIVADATVELARTVLLLDGRKKGGCRGT